jgi:hypothetical protein
MRVPINVKPPNNTSKWQMGFNLAFKGLIQRVPSVHYIGSDSGSSTAITLVPAVVETFLTPINLVASGFSTNPPGSLRCRQRWPVKPVTIGPIY